MLAICMDLVTDLNNATGFEQVGEVTGTLKTFTVFLLKGHSNTTRILSNN